MTNPASCATYDCGKCDWCQDTARYISNLAHAAAELNEAVTAALNTVYKAQRLTKEVATGDGTDFDLFGPDAVDLDGLLASVARDLRGAERISGPHHHKIAELEQPGGNN
jgi:hypothetical protein